MDPTRHPPPPWRLLVTGHFSTFGDVEVLHRVEAELHRRGLDYSVSPFANRRLAANPTWVDAATLDPSGFTHVVVVCGPFAPDYPQRFAHIFGRFRHCVTIGVNLTMTAPLSAFDPFDALIERDSDRAVRPDLSFAVETGRVPVVGLCLARPQIEYGTRQRLEVAADHLRRLARRAGCAVVEMDTVVPREDNRQGIGSAAEFESICARLDAVLTTRLHGMVLALKCGVPVLAIDAIAGGAKVTSQAGIVGWPEVLSVDNLDAATLDAALVRCLAPEARERAKACAAGAVRALDRFATEFAAALEEPADPARRPLVAPKRRGPLSHLAAVLRAAMRRLRGQRR